MTCGSNKKIKREHTRSVIPFNILEVEGVIHTLRGNNTNKDNCVHLAADFIRYARTGILPTSPSRDEPSTLEDFTAHIVWCPIKKETYESHIDRSTVLGSAFPCGTSIDYDEDIVNLESRVVDVDSLRQTSCDITRLNDDLLSSNSSLGVVCLARKGDSLHDPGHMVVYWIHNGALWFIDIQNDRPLYQDIPSEYNLEEEDFSSRVFYAPIV